MPPVCYIPRLQIQSEIHRNVSSPTLTSKNINPHCQRSICHGFLSGERRTGGIPREAKGGTSYHNALSARSFSQRFVWALFNHTSADVYLKYYYELLCLSDFHTTLK